MSHACSRLRAHSDQELAAAQVSVDGQATCTREPSTRRDVRHLALKRKDILTPATTGVDIEDAVLSDLSQPQNDNYWMSPCTGVPRGARIVETESRRAGARDRGGGEERVLHGDGVSV